MRVPMSRISERRKQHQELTVQADSDRDRPGDHRITIDKHHVLIHEAQGAQNQGAAQKPPEEGRRGHELMDNREVETQSYRLFEASGFGSNSTERSMWVISKDGHYEFVRCRWSAEAGKETWKLPVP